MANVNAAFFDAVRQIFGGRLSQPQVDGINAILEAWGKHGDGDERKLAYILATARHETANTMQPVRETLAKTDAKAKEILTKAWKSGKLKVSRDYWSSGFFGRGLVQLTHKTNYQKAGKALGLDLVGTPSLAMQPDVSAAILVRGMMEGWFTGKKLADYPNDFVSARAIVNGKDRATLIAGYAYRFLEAIEKASAKPIPATPFPDDGLPADPNGLPPAGGNSAGWIVLAATAVSGIVIAGWDWIVAVTGIVSPWW